MSATSKYGEAQKTEQGYTVRFERHFNHPVSKVWEAITNPELVSQWLANVSLELKEGAPVLVQFTNTDSRSRGHVTRVKEGELLEYTWQWGDEPVSLVCWELFSEGKDRCHLIFTHLRLEGDIPCFTAGWHVHLDMLADILDGRVSGFHWSRAQWDEEYKTYQERMK